MTEWKLHSGKLKRKYAVECANCGNNYFVFNDLPGTVKAAEKVLRDSGWFKAHGLWACSEDCEMWVGEYFDGLARVAAKEAEAGQ